MNTGLARFVAVLVSAIAVVVLRRALGMAVGREGVDFILRLANGPLYSSIVFLAVPSAVVGVLASRWLGNRPLLYGSLIGISVYLILLAIGSNRIVVQRCTFGGGPTIPLPVSTGMVIEAYLKFLPQQLLPLIIGSSLGLWLGALIAKRPHG